MDHICSHKAPDGPSRYEPTPCGTDSATKAQPSCEQLLIDHTVLCWLRLQSVELSYSSAMNRSLSLSEGDFWDRHLAAAQRPLHVRACETLARLRRLLHRQPSRSTSPRRGGTQVNVSGDVHLDHAGGQ